MPKSPKIGINISFIICGAYILGMYILGVVSLCNFLSSILPDEAQSLFFATFVPSVLIGVVLIKMLIVNYISEIE